MPGIRPITESGPSVREPTAHGILPYVVLFAVAAVVRLLVAWIFFGSIDIVNSTIHSASLFDGVPLDPPVPYFPGISLFIWLGGHLALGTGLPVSFCYKLFPCLFDSLIALLIASGAEGRPHSLRLGYLYALAPVPIIVMSLHGQWDSIFLYFLLLAILLLRIGSRWGDVFAGAAFVLSVIAKPVAVPLLLFFFPAPWLLFGRRSDGQSRMRAMTLVVSMAACAVVYRLLLAALHVPLGLEELRHIFGYAQHGVQLMGLPVLVDIDMPRIVGLMSLLALLPAYWSGRLSRERAILLFFAFVAAVCGSAPQYLCWIVPFAILSGDLVFNALYNLAGGTVLLLYYQTPGIGGRNVENLATLAPLRRVAWLAPSLTNLLPKHLVMFYGGNLLIPAIAIVFFVMAMLRITRSGGVSVARGAGTLPQTRAIVGSILLVCILAGALGMWAKFQPLPTGRAFTQRVRKQIESEYWCVRFTEVDRLEPPVWVLPSFVGPVAAQPVNIFNIGMGWILVWTTGAFAVARVGEE